MNFFLKKRISFWVILFLLFTNIATISTIVYHRNKFRKSMHFRNPYHRLNEFVNEELKLSEAQQKKLESVKDSLHSSRKLRFDKISKAQQSMCLELANNNSNLKILDSLNTQISINIAQMSKTTLQYFIAVKNVCDDSQKQKLCYFFKQVQKDMEKDMNEIENIKQND